MKVIVGLSGGVDSSVTALLLKNQGYDVEGLFMKNWEDEENLDCPVAQDLRDVMQVCEIIDIPLHVENFASEYRSQVFSHFISEYEKGRTPNPDILCNKEIKFRVFLDHAKSLGADFIATGHYAGINKLNSTYHLCVASDDSKDQTYFLYALGQYQLENSLFPLHHWQKKDVRAFAEKNKLPVYGKKDSTGICFIGAKSFKSFLNKYIQGKQGDIVDTNGNILGQHHGLIFHTIGQRKGLEIGGIKDHDGSPWYVYKKDAATNTLYVAPKNHQCHYHKIVFTEQISWVNAPPSVDTQLQARLRHQQPLQKCFIKEINNESFVLEFLEYQWAISPGQSVVLYDNGYCIGGGVIASKSYQALNKHSKGE